MRDDSTVRGLSNTKARWTVLGMLAAVAGMLLPLVLVGVSVNAAPAAAHDDCVNAIGTARSVTTLCVESSADGSRTAPYAGTINKGDRITTFDWLINDDSTGATDMSDVNVAVCLPDRARPNPLAIAGSPEEIYNNSGRGLHRVAAGTPKTPWWTNPAGTYVVNTSGTPDIPYGPENCPWPSVRSSSAHSDVVTTGTEANLPKLANLPDGKYLVSVTAANFKIDGVHFTVAGGTVVSVNDELNVPFIVRMNPLPKKTATVHVHVYNDNASTNGQWDGQTETLVTCADATPAQQAANCGGSADPNLVGDPSTDMSGFSVQITDVLNPVTTDVFGNPLCTVYETDNQGNVILNGDGSPNPIVFGDVVTTKDPVTGAPVQNSTSSAIPSQGGQSGGMLAGTQSGCISDHYGDIVIPNMGPNRYAATVIPPDPRTHNGDQWVQTTTLEGGHDWDTWNIEGGTGYDTELIVGGERVPPVAHGFVKLTHSDGQTTDYKASHNAAAVEAWYYDASKGFDDANVISNKSGELTGRIMIGRAYIGSGPNSSGTVVPLAGTNLANAKADGPIEDGLVSINCIATCSAPTDSAVWVGRAHKDGTFDVKGLETGDYSVAFWDETQNYIMATLQYHVTSTPFSPAVNSALRAGSSNNRTYTLNFASNAGFVVGDYLTTTAGGSGWTGTFQVLSVSPNGRAVQVTKTSGQQPSASINTPNVVLVAPFVRSATLATDPLSTAQVKPNVPTLVFGRSPGVPLGSTIELAGGNHGWAGNFLVKWVSADGLTITLDKVNGANPTSAATTLPSMNVTGAGDILLSGWFTDLQGSVFNDLNGNAIRDECNPQTENCAAQIAQGYQKTAEGTWTEPGIPDFVLTERTRGNSLQDQGAAVAKTNDEGTYDLSQGYPLGQFLIFEAYNQRFKNTGITYTTDNDPTPHTITSAQVDYNFLPVIGLSAKIDVGVQAYGTGTDYWSGDTSKPAAKDENGAIVGTVGYDVTRNEFDPAYSVQEDYQPGISGISMQLWKTHKSDGAHPDTWSAPGESGAVKQYGTTAAGAECLRPDASRGTNAVKSVQPCLPYDYYVTESWTRPTGCQALDVNGQPLVNEQSLPAAETPIDYSHTDPTHHDCVEAPMSGFQIGGDGTVDGNFALTSLIHGSTLSAAIAAHADLEQVYAGAQNNPDQADPLPSGDYVVEAVNPTDTVNASNTSDPTNGGFSGAGGAMRPKGLYRYTDEGVVNVMTGDTYVPQEGFTGQGGDVNADGTYHLHLGTHKNIRADVNTLGAGTVAKCAGTIHTVTNENPDFAAAGGSPYLGEKTPICDAKVVKVVGGRSVNPGFFMFTDVPIPAKFYGLMNDDLNVNIDRRSIMLGEVAPVSNGPVGVYDENGNWKYTAHTDVNGFYEAILPSMDTYSCPLPAGPCPNMYRLVGNDPGTLAHRNTDYNPQFRTIATEFQAWAGVVHPVDQAPTHQGITIEGPAAQFGALSLCKLADNNPSFFAIDKPYYDSDGNKTYTVDGTGFGSAPLFTFSYTRADGTVDPTKVYFVTPSFAPSVAHPLGWNFTIPSGMRSNAGPYQLSITNNDATSGLKSVNALTFHVLGSGYLGHNDVYIVSPNATTDSGNTFTPQMDAWDPVTDTPAGFSGTSSLGHAVSGGRAIQRAVEAAYQHSSSGTVAKLVVIYPNTAPNYAPHNAFAAYFENVVLHGKVKLQGVGPGSTVNSSTIVNGTNIDASQFWSATQVVPAGGNQDTADGSYSDDWRTFAAALPRAGAGPAELPEGEGVLAIAETTSQYANLGNGNPDLSRNLPLFHPGVDGILLTGGDQQGNPGNIDTAPGAVGNGTIAPTPPGPAQGGAIMLDQYVRDFSITNDLIQSNGGTYGTVRIGTPDLGTNASQSHNHNERLMVANNRFVANGGTNLAGALGIFYGADKYTVKNNDFCGNFSAEYGGAISHYGASPGGQILNNRIYYNQGYDEGGGIIIAGNLPANNSTLSDGAGGYYYVGNTRTLGGVTIDGNTLVSNQSNDDGGGIRFLMAGDVPLGSSYPSGGVPFVVTNNIIANNLSTHEGGGIAIDDTPNIKLVNNTIVKNITTGTAATNAAILGGTVRPQNPAGLSTGANSSLLQAKLPGGSPLFSNPTMFNNIFEDNRAGWAALATTANTSSSLIHGIGGPGDTTEVWDMGVVGLSGALLSPTNSVLSPTTPVSYPVGAGGVIADPSNVVTAIGNVKFVNPQDFQVDSLMWRPNTNVSYPVIVAQMVPVNLLTDYHLHDASSAAYNAGASVKSGTNAPSIDIDIQGRPALGAFDIGADEFGATAVGGGGGGGGAPTKPTLTVLDNFNRSNGSNGGTLGGSWNQLNGTFHIASQQANATATGTAIWSDGNSLGSKQGAAFQIVSATSTSDMEGLLLKQTGSGSSRHFIRLRVSSSTRIVVESTTNNGGGFSTATTFILGTALAANDVITAVANADGTVDVWVNNTYVGVSASTGFTGGGRIGMELKNGSTVDNFAGGTL